MKLASTKPEVAAARDLIAGETPGEHFAVRTSEDQAAEIVHAIFPIVMWRQTEPVVAVGTGFFVGMNGLFVTAKHVIEAALNNDGKLSSQLGILQLMSENKFYLREIVLAASHPVADVAIGYAIPMKHKITGAPMPNKTLTLASEAPALGSDVFTYAYPRTKVIGSGPGTEGIECTPGYFVGKLSEAHPNGRDRVLLPGPCFRTSMVIHGGASGGPVMTVDGRVFAVNSTGVSDDTVSYVTCVSSAFDLPIPGVVLPDSSAPRSSTLREFNEHGLVLIR